MTGADVPPEAKRLAHTGVLLRALPLGFGCYGLVYRVARIQDDEVSPYLGGGYEDQEQAPSPG